MHNAPAVAYPVGRCALYGALLGALAALSSVALALAVHGAPAWGWRQSVLLLTCLAVCGWALRAWRQSPQGLLRWDGQRWFWRDAPGSVQVGLDAQRWLCVHWHAHGNARETQWLCLEPGMAPLLWMDLRRALYSPRSSTEHHATL